MTSKCEEKVALTQSSLVKGWIHATFKKSVRNQTGEGKETNEKKQKLQYI